MNIAVIYLLSISLYISLISSYYWFNYNIFC